MELEVPGLALRRDLEVFVCWMSLYSTDSTSTQTLEHKCRRIRRSDADLVAVRWNRADVCVCNADRGWGTTEPIPTDFTMFGLCALLSGWTRHALRRRLPLFEWPDSATSPTFYTQLRRPAANSALATNRRSAFGEECPPDYFTRAAIERESGPHAAIVLGTCACVCAIPMHCYAQRMVHTAHRTVRVRSS